MTKIFLGAFTLFSNGHVMSRAGTALVAMIANAYNVPVIVCCETYKFCERAQIDSICFNELGDPDEIISVDGDPGTSGESGDQATINQPVATTVDDDIDDTLYKPRSNPNLKLLNLVYDVMPSSFVTMVVTEVGFIPPTSVPVIIREFPLQEEADDA